MLKNRLDEIETWKSKYYKIEQMNGGNEKIIVLNEEINRLNKNVRINIILDCWSKKLIGFLQNIEFRLWMVE